MDKIQVNIKDVLQTVSKADIEALQGAARASLAKLTDGTGLGADFLGWVKLPTTTPDALLDDITATAASLRENCDVVVCIGIGGSYLGAKAVLEALGNAMGVANGPQILFAGQNIGEDYLFELQEYLRGKRFGIIVISKSGTTTEPAVAFRFFRDALEKKYLSLIHI